LFSFFRYKDPDEKAVAAFVRETFGIRAKQPLLYKQAFLHKSHLRDEPKAHERSNERLEFLGDAVLDTIVAEYLYQNYPSETEGFLTKIKSRIVKRETLNLIGEQLRLNRFIRHTQYGINNPKSLLGNAVEALIGAVYIDHGFEVTRKVVLERILYKYINLNEIVQVETDYKSRIIIWSQRERKRIEFVLVLEENLGPEMRYEIELQIDQEPVTRAIARTKKEAEQDASRMAWRILFESKQKDSEEVQ
jgi:ribonuclease III